MDIIKENEARVLAKNFSVAQFKVPERNIVILRTMLVTRARICWSSYSIEMNVVTATGREDKHQVSVNTANGNVVLIY